MASRIVAAVFGALLMAGAARATPLATIPIGLFSSDPEVFGGNTVETAIDFRFWVDPSSDPSPDIGEGFQLLHFVLTAADSGHTLVASALNMGPDFTSAVALLTNATLNDYLSTSTNLAIGGGGGGSGTNELGVLNLIGKSVGSVKLVVDQLTIDVPGTDPNNDGIWTDVVFNGSLVFDTDVPIARVVSEPGMLGLVAAGLGVLGWLRRRR